MKTSNAETLQRLSNALKNLSSARERLDKGGKIKGITIAFEKGDQPKDQVFIAQESILDFGDIKTQLVASVDERIESIKAEMRSLLS